MSLNRTQSNLRYLVLRLLITAEKRNDMQRIPWFWHLMRFSPNITGSTSCIPHFLLNRVNGSAVAPCQSACLQYAYTDTSPATNDHALLQVAPRNADWTKWSRQCQCTSHFYASQGERLNLRWSTDLWRCQLLYSSCGCCMGSRNPSRRQLICGQMSSHLGWVEAWPVKITPIDGDLCLPCETDDSLEGSLLCCCPLCVQLDRGPLRGCSCILLTWLRSHRLRKHPHLWF